MKENPNTLKFNDSSSELIDPVTIIAVPNHRKLSTKEAITIANNIDRGYMEDSEFGKIPVNNNSYSYGNTYDADKAFSIIETQTNNIGLANLAYWKARDLTENAKYNKELVDSTLKNLHNSKEDKRFSSNLGLAITGLVSLPVINNTVSTLSNILIKTPGLTKTYF